MADGTTREEAPVAAVDVGEEEDAPSSYKLFDQTENDVNNVYHPSDSDGRVLEPSSTRSWNVINTSTWLERNAPTSIPPALLGTGTFFGGILREYKIRYTPAMLKSDFIDGFTFKTKSASLFMFCATIVSTVALGEVAYRETNGFVGITEYLMLQGVGGTLHALFAACPMVILRPTGPITAFMIDLYNLAGDLDVDYYALISWVGM